MANYSTKSALIWATADKIVTNGFALIVSIILARLIAPSEFGIIATAMIFTVILSLFVEPGMTSALIQKKKPDEYDYSTILIFNLVAGIILYLILFLSAGIIAIWFDIEELDLVLRIMGLQIIIGGVNSVQIAFVQKNMFFKKYFICSLTSAILSAGAAISLAYLGYGVWALVLNNILRSLILLISVTIAFRWRFFWAFSMERFKEMFPFASKMLIAKFFDQGYVEITQTIISKVFSPTALAFYNRGKSFPDLLISNINSALGNVLFPVFSNIQDDKKQLEVSITNAIGMTSYVCFPLLIGMLACAQNFIVVLLTEKWISCVPYLQLICLYYLWVPFSNIVWQSLKAIGASNKVLQLEILKVVLNIATLIGFIMIIKSPLAVALSLVVSYFISFLIENVYLIIYLGVSYKSIMRNFLPSLLLSVIMGVIVLIVGQLIDSPIIAVCLQLCLGIITYLSLSIVCKMPQYKQLRSLFIKQ